MLHLRNSPNLPFSLYKLGLMLSSKADNEDYMKECVKYLLSSHLILETTPHLSPMTHLIILPHLIVTSPCSVGGVDPPRMLSQALISRVLLGVSWIRMFLLLPLLLNFLQQARQFVECSRYNISLKPHKIIDMPI